MESMLKFFAKQKAFANALTIIVVIFGLYAVTKIKREAFPNIAYNVLSVQTYFPGASAEEVERLVTNPLEQELREVSGIKRLTSVSVEGLSLVYMQLDPNNSDMPQVKDDVQMVVDRISTLPEDVEDPVLRELSSKFEPIIEIGLSGDLSQEKIREHAKLLERKLETISQTARVDIRGLQDIEIKIVANSDKLRNFGVTLPEIFQALATRNVNIPGGTLEVPTPTGHEEFVIRTIGEFQSIDDVNNVVIRANPLGEAIRIQDVASVTEGFEKPKILYRTNGKAGLSLVVLKKENADAIDLVDDVKSAVESYKLEAGPDLKVAYINDFSFFIRRRIGVLGGNLIIGLALVLIVLSLTLPFRAAVVTAFGIPFAFLGTILFFFATGVSINLLSLMGLIIVVGMLVDDAVVVAENSQRFQDMGLSSEEAAVKGAAEVLLPVVFSVLTTIAAFTPLMMMSGIMGKFISYIPIGVIVALSVSLFEAFFILPQHFISWKFLGTGQPIPTERIPEYPAIVRPFLRLSLGFQDLFLKRWIPRYERIIRRFLRHRYRALGGLIIFVLLTGLVAKTRLKFVLFPPGGIEAFVVNFEGPEGVPLEKMLELLKPAEKLISDMSPKELKDFTLKIGEMRLNQGDPNSKSGAQYAQMVVHLTPETARKRTAEQIADSLRPSFEELQNFKRVSIEQVQGGPPVGTPINLGVRGNNYEQINKAVDEILKYLATIKGTKDVKSSFVLGKKEIRVVVDNREAAAAGLSVRDVGTTVRAAFEGLVPTSIKKLDEDIDVRVSLDTKGRTQSKILEDLIIPNSRGNLVSLARIAKVTNSQGIAAYEHEGNQRQVKITGNVDVDIVSSTEVNELLRKQIPEWNKSNPGLSYFFGGEDEDTQESMSSLGRAFLAAFFMIFMLLVVAFGNFFQPVLVAFAIPMGVLAVLWTFVLHGKPLSFLAMIGLVALAGVIVNNSIVIVDFINRLREEGKDPNESIVEACLTRLRPIFLTSFTTIVGILPTAYGIGGLDPFVMPVALALGWGLAFGSVLTLLFLPPVLAIGDDLTKIFKFRKN
jgi:multidrug efflux pump subunit AcrB